MQRRVSILIACAIVVAAVGCNTLPKRPEIKHAGIAPPELKPGDTAVITVTVDDRFGIVDHVEGVVKEDPEIVFHLLDDGVPPDKKAGDGTWSLQVDVPFNAPPGTFEVTVSAYNVDGQAILIMNEEGETEAVSASFELVIRFPVEP